MIRTTVTISNKLGLHARASAKLTKLAGTFGSDIFMSRNGRRVNAKSIMGVMMLAAGLGAEVEIETDGADEREAMDALIALGQRQVRRRSVVGLPSVGQVESRRAIGAGCRDRRAARMPRMSFQVFGLPVSRGVAIGRAVLVASSRVDVAHYFIDETQVESEIDRLRVARDAVATELGTLQRDMPADAPAELSALLDVHLMLLHDETLTGATKHWIRERHYNAEWALSAQLEVLARQFDEMEDEYLRERKADLEQVVERLLARDGARRYARRARRARRATSAARIRWCWWPTTSRRPTCCSSSAACSPASSPTSAARPRTPRSSRAAWTSPPSWARARRAA